MTTKVGDAFPMDAVPTEEEVHKAFGEYVEQAEWITEATLNDMPNKPTRWEVIPIDSSRLVWLKVYTVWQPTGDEMESLWQCTPADDGVTFREIF